MFLQQPDGSHPVFQQESRVRVIANRRDSQWDESDSCCSSEPQLIDEDEHSFGTRNRKEDERDCEMVATQTTSRSCDASISGTECTAASSAYSLRNFLWLPMNQESQDDETSHHYRGIPYNPPEVCSEGVGRGNLRLLHRKAWLEASDPKHRYGKHLRMYHRHWEESSASSPSSSRNDAAVSSFFDWLDSQGAYQGQPFPEIADCPRTRLDSDRVAYINDARESQRYAVRVQVEPGNNNRRGQLVCAETGMPVRTGTAGWMFVLRDNILYAAPKGVVTTNNNNCSSQSPQRFHHSSFFGGRAVQAAGIFVTCCRTACLTQILPHSGHYRPGESDVQRVLYHLQQRGICWTTFSLDVQQFLHIDRSTTHHSTHQRNGSDNSVCVKKKKTESLHLRSALYVADYLSHKARCVDGIFAAIEARRVEV